MRRPAFHFLVLLLSTAVFYVFLRDPGLNTNDRAFFTDLVHGRAHKPFVYRILVPGSVRLLSALVPETLQRRADALASTSKTLGLVWQKARLEPGHAVEHGIGFGLMFLGLWGFPHALRWLVQGVVPGRPGFADGVAIAALLGVPGFFKYTAYPNDPWTLLLLTLGIALLARERFGAYLGVFLLGALNKETTVLLALLFVLQFGAGERRLERARFSGLLAAQAAILVGIKLLLAWIFRGNMGAFVEVHLLRHNREHLTAWSLTTILVLSGAVLLAAHGWSEKPRIVRVCVWPMLALGAFNLVFAWVEETRVWYEAYPFALLLLSDGAARFLGFLPGPMSRTRHTTGTLGV